MAKPRHPRRSPVASPSKRKGRGESSPVADAGRVVATHPRGRSQWSQLPVDLLLLILVKLSDLADHARFASVCSSWRSAAVGRSQWSHLPVVLLEMILEKINNVADHARFASVCSRWRSVAVENPPINKPLYFALSHDPENLVRQFITSFVPNSWKTAKFIGALDGWLVVLIDRKDLFLLNKAINSIIPLPPPPPLQNLDFSDRRDICKAVLSSPPSGEGECTVVIKQFKVGLFCCSLGSDKSFTKFYATSDCICDILFYKGRLYVLCHPNTIVIFDHLLSRVPQSQQWLSYYACNPSTPWRFLISENNILSIVAGQPHRYSVFTFTFTLEGTKPRVVRVNNIGEDKNFRILLSNSYCSLSITTKEHNDFQRYSNCFNIPSNSTIVIDTSEEDSNKAKLDDPRPLFFIMFSNYEIKKSGPKKMKKKEREMLNITKTVRVGRKST